MPTTVTITVKVITMDTITERSALIGSRFLLANDKM